MKPSIFFTMMALRGATATVKALLDRVDVGFVSLEPSLNILRKAGVEACALPDFTPDKAGDYLVPAGQARLNRALEALNSEDLRAAYPQFSDDVWGRFMDTIRSTLERDFLTRTLEVEMMRRCIFVNDLRLLVVSEDVLPSTRTMVCAARDLGVPSLQVIHSAPCGPPTPQIAVSATHFAVYSAYVKGLYVRMGVDPDRMFVTGNPAWDHLLRPPLPGHREELCNKMGLDSRCPIINYALTNPSPWSVALTSRPNFHIDTAQAVLGAFAALAKDHPDWQFVLRPRPAPDDSADVNALVQYAGEQGLASLFIDRLSPYDSIVLTDVVMATESNMSIEAVLQGKRTINVSIDAFGADALDTGLGRLFDPGDAVLEARKGEEIAPLIERAVLDAETAAALRKARPRTIRKFNQYRDGRSAERLADVIVQLMQSGHKDVKPQRHHPQLEPVLAAAVRYGARRIHVAGAAARWTAAAIAEARPGADISHSLTLDGLSADAPDTIVFSDPLPSSPETVELLRRAREALGTDGAVVAAFPCAQSINEVPTLPTVQGALPRQGIVAPHAEQAIPLILSRADLEPVSMRAFNDPRPESGQSFGDGTAEGWVVCAGPRRLGL